MPRKDKLFAIVDVDDDMDGGTACWDHEQTAEHIRELLGQGIDRDKIAVYRVGARMPVSLFVDDK